MQSLFANPGGDDLPPESHGFCGLTLGSTKAQAERVVAFSNYTDIEGAAFTSASAELIFHGISIYAHLSFEREYGLQTIHGGFPRVHFDSVKMGFIRLFGPADDDWMLEPSIRTYPKGEGPGGELAGKCEDGLTSPVSLLWHKKRMFVSLHRITYSSFSQLQIATYRYMKTVGSWKVTERGRRALVLAGEITIPPVGWPQEPVDFKGLKFGMSANELKDVVPLSNVTQIGRCISAAYKVPLQVGSIDVIGRFDFHAGRLVAISGEFDIGSFEAVESEFIERYGEPHYRFREPIPEGGRLDQLFWVSEWLEIGMGGWFGGTDPGRFHVGPSSDTYLRYLQQRALEINMPG